MLDSTRGGMHGCLLTECALADHVEKRTGTPRRLREPNTTVNALLVVAIASPAAIHLTKPGLHLPYIITWLPLLPHAPVP